MCSHTDPDKYTCHKEYVSPTESVTAAGKYTNSSEYISTMDSVISKDKWKFVDSMSASG